MKPITVKRIVIGSIALVTAIFALLSLCFAVIEMDMSAAMGTVGSSIAGQLGIPLSAGSENGFDLLDGKSGILAAMKTLNLMVAQLQADPNVTVTYATYEWLGVLSQVFNILILVVSILAIVSVFLWFFFCKSNKLINSVAIVSVIAAVLYLVEGIVFNSVMQNDINKAFGELFKDTELGTMISGVEIGCFSTKAFLPIIFVGILAIGFLVTSIVLKEREAGAAEYGEAAPMNGVPVGQPIRRVSGKEWKGAPQGYSAAGTANTDNVFSLLGKLKEAFDNGILTQEEFEEQKIMLLSSTKFDYLRNIWNMQLRGVISEEEYSMQKAVLFKQITAKTQQMAGPVKEAEPKVGE